MVKKVFLILILTILLISTTNIVQASSIFQGADNWIENGANSAGTVIKQDKLDLMNNTLYNILLIIGTAVAVIVGAVLGIQFITGSVEQKGKIKEALIPFVIGCVVIFGAFGIWRIVITILK